MQKIVELKNTLPRTLIILFKASPMYFLITSIGSLLLGVGMPIVVLIWKNVIDEISLLLDGSKDYQDMIVWLVLYLLINILSKVIQCLLEYSQVIFSEHVDMSIKNMLLDKIVGFDLAAFDDSELYNEILKSTSESSMRSLAILKTFLDMLQFISSLVGTIILLIVYNSVIIFLCMLSSIPLFLLSCKVMDQLYDIYTERFEKIRFAKTIESLLLKNENIKEIKVFQIGDYLKQEILSVYQKNLDEDKIIRKRIAKKNIAVNVFSEICLIGVKILAIFLAISQSFTIGTITLYISSIDNLNLSFQNILNSFGALYENSMYMRSIFLLLNRDHTRKSGEKIAHSIDSIEFKNVSFKYPGSHNYVLKDINIKFEKENSYALVGYNGAGKTTLIKLLLGLYLPSSGSILLNGFPIEEYNQESIFPLVSSVFQDFIHFPFNIQKNIGLGNLEIIDEDERILDVCEKVGVKDFVEKLPNGLKTQLQREWADSIDLSLGLWQKLAIARAMVRDSKLLVLDEPTASIDALSENFIFQKFDEMKERKMCIIVTHRLSNVKNVDCIVVIDSSKVVERGTHEELMNQDGLYKELYTVQASKFN